VAGVLSIMATEKINAMVSKEHFEGLLKYYECGAVHRTMGDLKLLS
jgi:hypothetical protein